MERLCVEAAALGAGNLQAECAVLSAQASTSEDRMERIEDAYFVATSHGDALSQWRAAQTLLSHYAIDDFQIDKAKAWLEFAQLAALKLDNPLVQATLESEIGLLRWMENDLDQAEAALLRSISIFESSGLHDHENLRYAHSRLGMVFATAGRGDDAIAEFEWALADAKARHGEVHPAVLRATNNLTGGLLTTSRLQESLEYAEIAVQLADALYEIDDPGRLYVEGNYASILYDLGEFARAHSHNIRAHELADGRFGKESQDALNYKLNVAISGHALGRIEEAERIAREVQVSAEANLGAEDAFTRRASAVLADVLEDKGSKDEATHFFESAIDGLSEKDIYARQIFYIYGRAMADRGECAKAISSLERSNASIERRLAAGFDPAARVLIGICQFELGDKEKGRETVRQARTDLVGVEGTRWRDMIDVADEWLADVPQP